VAESEWGKSSVESERECQVREKKQEKEEKRKRERGEPSVESSREGEKHKKERKGKNKKKAKRKKVIGHLLFITFFPLPHASTFLLPASILLRPAATAVSASVSRPRSSSANTGATLLHCASVTAVFVCRSTVSPRRASPAAHHFRPAPTAQAPFCRWLLLPTTRDAT